MVGGGFQPGLEGDPRPVGDKVAGVATAPQGQYGLSHLFHWKHFLKEIILQKKIETTSGCVLLWAGDDRQSQEILEDMADTDSNVFNFQPFD